MTRVPTISRKRLSKSEALEQARSLLKEDHDIRRPKNVTTEDRAIPRDRDRPIELPSHLAVHPGEHGIISSGFIWTHRADWQASIIDAVGTKRTPIRPVCLGPVAALNPDFKSENPGPGQAEAEGDKTPGFVLGSGASRSIDHLSENERVLSPQGGRPKKTGSDHVIQQLATEGQGSKAIARSLGRLDSLVKTPSHNWAR